MFLNATDHLHQRIQVRKSRRSARCGVIGYNGRSHDAERERQAAAQLPHCNFGLPTCSSHSSCGTTAPHRDRFLRSGHSGRPATYAVLTWTTSPTTSRRHCMMLRDPKTLIRRCVSGSGGLNRVSPATWKSTASAGGRIAGIDLRNIEVGTTEIHLMAMKIMQKPARLQVLR